MKIALISFLAWVLLVIIVLVFLYGADSEMPDIEDVETGEE